MSSLGDIVQSLSKLSHLHYKKTNHSRECVYRFYLSTFVYVDKGNVQQDYLFLSQSNDVQMYNIPVFDYTVSKEIEILLFVKHTLRNVLHI